MVQRPIEARPVPENAIDEFSNESVVLRPKVPARPVQEYVGVGAGLRAPEDFERLVSGIVERDHYQFLKLLSIS